MGFFFFFNDTATTEIYTLSLHDALPISNERTGEAQSLALTMKWRRKQQRGGPVRSFAFRRVPEFQIERRTFMMSEKQSEKQGPIAMEEPLKKHGDKIDRGRLGGIDKEHASDQKGGA